MTNEIGMTVGDLRKAMATIPDDVVVILSKDEEGNNFSPLADTDGGLYVQLTTYEGEAFVGDDQAEAPDWAATAFVLYPTN